MFEEWFFVFGCLEVDDCLLWFFVDEIEVVPRTDFMSRDLTWPMLRLD